MEHFLSRFDGGEIIGFMAVGGGFLCGIIAILAGIWCEVRRTEITAALKQDMVNRGMSADDIGHITVLVQDHAELAAIDREWCAMFPDPHDRPARQVMQLGLQRRSRAQFHMLAAC